MDCKWHSGTEADLVCLKCGQAYCRECVKETREAHYCPDCHRASVERLAAQMGGRKEPKPTKVKAPKPPRVKEPKPPKPPKEDKRLRKPAERVIGPTLDDLAAPPPPPEEVPEPSLSPEERAAFWEDSGVDEKVAPFTASAPERTSPQAPPATPPTAEAELHIAPPLEEAPVTEGPPARPVSRPRAPSSAQAEVLSPPAASAPDPAVPAPPLGPPPGSAPVKKRPVPSREEREAAVMAAEGFPTGGSKRTPGRRAAAAEAGARAVHAVPDGAEAIVPPGRLERLLERRRGKRTANLPVAMQIPDDYDGELTGEASYLKAIGLGFAVGILFAAAFAALAWLVHKDLGIFGWMIGFSVGVAVAFGSGRHFSWRLGLIAAGITLVCVSLQRISYFMLDVRFNKILPLKLGIWPLFRESFNTYLHSFWTLWLVFFLLSGLVAFLVSFRPPPVKLQISEGRGAPRGRVAGGKV